MTANQEEAKMEKYIYIEKKFDRMCKTNSKYIFVSGWISFHLIVLNNRYILSL